jgi:hypothetical protein
MKEAGHGEAECAELPVVRAAELALVVEEERWLIRDFWARGAVGLLGGPPKVGKSWLGLDMAVSVASNTACLGHFPVEHRGPALVYLAEDALPLVRERLAGLCAHRGIALGSLDVHVITSPRLRLDDASDLASLVTCVERLEPHLLLLDPLVRLHTGDENSSSDISALLGDLRELSRAHDLAIVVVHHMSKHRGRDLGQALRGSGDLYAWGDENAFLVRTRGELLLTLEHRASASPEPMPLTLVTAEHGAHLELSGQGDEHARTKTPLSETVRHALAEVGRPLSRGALRQRLRVNNQRLGDVLKELERDGHVSKSAAGWSLTVASDQNLPLPS